jgi:hypothetical protein
MRRLHTMGRRTRLISSGIILGSLALANLSWGAMSTIDSSGPSSVGAGVPDSDAPLFIQGSWRAPVKTSDTDPANRSACTLPATTAGTVLSPVGWRADDPAAIVTALESTHQNYYASHIDIMSDCNWASLKGIASEASERGAEIEIVAGLETPSFADKTPEDVARDYRDAITTTRQLADEHGVIKSVLIDDFSTALSLPIHEDPSDFLTRSDVASLHSAAHDSTLSAPAVRLTPYMSAKYAPPLLLPAHVLGIRGWPCGEEDTDCAGLRNETDYKLLEGDHISMRRSFARLLPLSDTAAFYRLSFLYDDYYDQGPIGDTADEEPLELVVRLNGKIRDRISLHDSLDDPTRNGIRLFDQTIAFESGLNPDVNFLSISIAANGRTVPKSKHKIAIVWDMKMKRISGTGTVRSVHLSTATYNKDSTDPDRTSTEPMISSSNKFWRIDRSVDGVLIKYTSQPETIELEAYSRFLESMQRHMGKDGKTFMSVFWGNEQWKEDLTTNLESRRRMYELNRDITDGVVVWRLENALHLPDGGVFTERRPIEFDSFDSTFDRLAFFPGQTSGTPGWRQRWTFDVNVSGEYTLDWTEFPERDGSNTSHSGRMVKQVIGLDSDGVEALIWEEDVNDTQIEGVERFYVDSDLIDQLIVGMAETGSIGNLDFGMQFNLTDPPGRLLWTDDYCADVDEATRGIYETTLEFFGATGAVSACP